MALPTGRGSTRARGSGLALGVWTVVAAEIVALVLWRVLRDNGVAVVPATSAAVAVGVLGAACALAPVSGVSLWGRLGRRIGYTRRRIRATELSPAPFDVPAPDGRFVGMRWDGDRMVSVVRIARRVEPRTVRPGASVVDGSTLRLGTIARALTQYDIELESIDVVAHGWRTRAAPHLTAPYHSLTQGLPLVSHQDVWVVLRLNPLQCPDAVHSRVGGPTGIIRTALAATRRVANHLAREGYRATILSAHAMSSMDSQLIDGAEPTTPDEGWTHVGYDRYRAHAYALTGPLDDAASTQIWSTSCLSATTATTVTRASADRFAMSTIIRFGTVEGVAPSAPGHAKPLPGMQLPAVAWSRPARRRSIREAPTEIASVATLDEVRMIDGSAGQLLGADGRGEAVLIPFFGPDVRRVDVYGQIYLASQIVARAVATGARVVVRTDRADAWSALADAVNDPHTLYVTRTATDQRYPPNTYSLCILDSREAIEDSTIGTQLRVHRDPARRRGLDEGSDVAVQQDPTVPTRVRLITESGSMTVTLVSIASENTLVEGARATRGQVEGARQSQFESTSTSVAANVDGSGRHSAISGPRHDGGSYRAR